MIGRSTRLLALWAEGGEDQEPVHPRVHVPPLDTHDLFEDAFMPIGRDGAGMVEVQLRLQKSLAALAQMGSEAFRASARHQAEIAMARAETALTLAADRERLKRDI